MRCSDCVFCKISSGQIISEFIHESKTCFAIRDINPIASTHVLIIPRDPYTSFRVYKSLSKL